MDSLFHFNRFLGDSNVGGAEEQRFLDEDFFLGLPGGITKPRNCIMPSKVKKTTSNLRFVKNTNATQKISSNHSDNPCSNQRNKETTW